MYNKNKLTIGTALHELKLGVSRRWQVRFTWLWILCVVIGSFLPSNVKMSLRTTPQKYDYRQENRGPAHRAWHFGTFSITAILLLALAETERRKIEAVVMTFGLGFAIEIAQTVFNTSSIEWGDVRDDGYAAAIGFVIFRSVARYLTVQD